MDFLDVTTRRNPKLIRTAVELHQSEQIPPNTFVIDLDAVARNAEVIKREADACKISLYFITKQFGRNPLVSKIIMNAGINSAIAVDIEEVKSLYRYGIPIGHIGHLVQVPTCDIEFVLSEVKPEVVTVFNVEKAKQISKVAGKLGIVQKLLVRVVGRGDFFYPQQEGGIPEEDVISAVRTINELENVKVVGVTSFPCFRFNLRTRKDEPTSNLNTILRVADRLKRELSLEVEQINAPSDNCVASMKMYAELGVTHVEPGNAFTGTTPWHAFEDLPEIPAWVYVSEVSHILGNKAYAYGGGLIFMDKVLGFWDYLYHQFFMGALVGSDSDAALRNRIYAEPVIPGALDYYFSLICGSKTKVNIGDTVVLGFRPQIFTSRAKVAVVNGISKGKPKLLGLFNRTGFMIDARYENVLDIEHVKKLMIHITGCH